MRAALQPPRESQRLEALRALHLLDTAQEERFDRIVRLAARVFQVQTALISLVDQDRQWFKARHGCPLRETPRGDSICAHAILEEEGLVVPDLRSDARFHEAPFVQDGTFLFYAGAVVRSASGEALGTLCLLHPQPRIFGSADLATLNDLARMVETELRAGPLGGSGQELLEATLLDERTGLPGQRLFRDELAQACARARTTEEACGVVRVRLDNLRRINSHCGRSLGNTMLQVLADRLRKHLPEGTILGRIRGAEFAFVVPPVWSGGDVQSRLPSLLHELQTPVRRGEMTQTPKLSVGVSGLDPNREPEVLIDEAGQALNREGSGRIQQLGVYTDSIDQELAKSIYMQERLERAIEGQRLKLHVQPKFDMRKRIIGGEALIRWHDEELGWVSPGNFIPMAEDTGLVVPLGWWVLEETCRFLQRGLRAGLDVPPLSINVSARQLQLDWFVGELLETLRAYDLDPSKLDVELTESLLIQDFEDVRRKLSELTEAGVSVSVDDFGTGYSSLAYLKRLPVSTLKIDRSFIVDMVDDEEDASIVQATIDLAHALRLKTVAEGVETREQMLVLKAFRCDQIQGFLLGRPMPMEDFRRLLT